MVLRVQAGNAMDVEHFSSVVYLYSLANSRYYFPFTLITYSEVFLSPTRDQESLRPAFPSTELLAQLVRLY